MEIKLIILVIFIIISIGVMNILCFLVGAKTGQKVLKNEDITIPKPPNLAKKIKDYKSTIEDQKEQENIKNMWDNINNYDGTGLGQKNID